MEDSGLSMYAVIQPAINPADVSTVIVITNFNGQHGGGEAPAGSVTP